MASRSRRPKLLGPSLFVLGSCVLAYLVVSAIRLPGPQSYYVVGGVFGVVLLLVLVRWWAGLLLAWTRRKFLRWKLLGSSLFVVGSCVLAYLVVSAIRLAGPQSYYVVSGVFGVALLLVLVKWWAGLLLAWTSRQFLRWRARRHDAARLTDSPLYLVLGAASSGKSAMLDGARCHRVGPILASPNARPVLEAWESQSGTFVEVIGDGLTPASDSTWDRMLEFAKRYRREPLNGVLVTLSVAELLGTQLARMSAERLRDRLRLVRDRLGCRVPVWVVLTHLDRVTGFEAFRGALPRGARQQLLGWTTLPNQWASLDPRHVRSSFDSVVHQLRAVRPAVLTHTSDVARAYAFPEEVAALREPLTELLHRAFPAGVDEPPFLRGVYLASATQQGSPATGTASRIAAGLGLPSADLRRAESDAAGPVFVSDLFGTRLEQDQVLAEDEPSVRRTRGFLPRVVMNGAGVAAGLLLAAIVLTLGVKARGELMLVRGRYEESTNVRGAVERTNALWKAAQSTSGDPYRNLGLSQQASLKVELELRQAKQFRTAVLEPLIDLLEQEANAISIGVDPADLVRRSQLLGHVTNALARAREPSGRPSTDLFSEVEKEAFVALGPRLEMAGVIGSQDVKTFPRALLLAVARNGTESATKRIDTMRARVVVESHKGYAAENPGDPTTYGQAALGTALAALVAVTAPMPEQGAEVKQRFGELLTAAQAHWDGRLADMPPYAGDAAAYLNEWVDPDGRVPQLTAAFEAPWPLQEELKNDPAAAAAWQQISALRERYAFFMEDGPLRKVQRELRRRLQLREVRLVAGSAPTELKRLDKELPGGGGPKPFSVAAWLADDSHRLIPDTARRDLDRACGEVLHGVLQDVSEYYNTAWGFKVDDVRAVLESDSKVEKNRAERELKNFVKELEILFGPGLRHNRGGLTVVPGVENGVTQVERLLGAAKVDASVRLTFDCELVPTSAAALEHPFVVLEYRSKAGGKLTSEPWQPRTPQPWDDIVWEEGQDDVFTVFMVKEDGSGKARFRRWSGNDALRRAIEDGGGGELLKWSGEGEFSDVEAHFKLQVSDSRMFQILMLGASSGGGGALNLPRTCVQLERR